MSKTEEAPQDDRAQRLDAQIADRLGDLRRGTDKLLATPSDGLALQAQGLAAEIGVLETRRHNLVEEDDPTWKERLAEAQKLLNNLAATRTTIEYQAFGVTITARGDEADPTFQEALERIHDLSHEHLELQKREMAQNERARTEHDQRQWMKTIADLHYADDGILTHLEVPPAIREEIEAAEGPLDSKFMNWLWSKMAKEIVDDDQG